MASPAAPVLSNSATMTDLIEPSPSPSPPLPLAPTSPHFTQSTAQLSASPTQQPTPLLPSPDISAPFSYGRVRVGPTSALPHPADETATAPHLRYLVMALGSTTLRYGTAEEFQPRSKAMAVAYRWKDADSRKRRRTAEEEAGDTEKKEDSSERKELNGVAMEEEKDVGGDALMKEQQKEPRSHRAGSDGNGSGSEVAAPVAAWHQQAGEDFTVLNAEVIKRRVQPVSSTPLNRRTHRTLPSTIRSLTPLSPPLSPLCC